MKKTILVLLLAALTSGAALALTDYSFAAEERQEVEMRLELNNVSADELVATGAVTRDIADKIIELRDQLGSFQTYEDLEELNIPPKQLEELQWNTTIQGIAADCTC